MVDTATFSIFHRAPRPPAPLPEPEQAAPPAPFLTATAPATAPTSDDEPEPTPQAQAGDTPEPVATPDSLPGDDEPDDGAPGHEVPSPAALTGSDASAEPQLDAVEPIPPPPAPPQPAFSEPTWKGPVAFPIPVMDDDQPGMAWVGPAHLPRIAVEADQLGLANPIIITLLARLKGSPAIELDARHSGIYRPQGFRTAPWSGFAYDEALDGGTGIAAGSRILTARGELEVENLLPGDTALTLRAPALVPINWIGKTSATTPPILIEAGALGPDLPRRELRLAPNQAVYVEPIPVPAKRLVNGTTIRHLDTAEVDIFHVDVGGSEILFAEGLPVASSDRVRAQVA